MLKSKDTKKGNSIFSEPMTGAGTVFEIDESFDTEKHGQLLFDEEYGLEELLQAELDITIDNSEGLTDKAIFECKKNAYKDFLSITVDSIDRIPGTGTLHPFTAKTIDILQKAGIVKDIKECTLPVKKESDLYLSREKLSPKEAGTLATYLTKGAELVGFSIPKDLKCYKTGDKWGKVITDEYLESKQFYKMHLLDIKKFFQEQDLFDEPETEFYYLWYEKDFVDGALYLMAENDRAEIELKPVYRPTSAKSGNLKLDMQLFAGICCYCNSELLNTYTQAFLQYLYKPNISLFIEQQKKKAEQTEINTKTTYMNNSFVKKVINSVDKGIRYAKIQGKGKMNPTTLVKAKEDILQPFALISNEEAIAKITQYQDSDPQERIVAINSICRDQSGRPVYATEKQLDYFDVQVIQPAFFSLTEKIRQTGEAKIITPEDICKQILQDPAKKFNDNSQLLKLVKESMAKQNKIFMYIPINAGELVRKNVIESEKALDKDLAYARPLIPFDFIIDQKTGEIIGYTPINRMPLYVIADQFGGKRYANEIEMSFKDVRYIEEKNGEKHEKQVPETSPVVINMRNYLVDFIDSFDYSIENGDYIEFDKMFETINANKSYETTIKDPRQQQQALSRQLLTNKQYFYALLDKQAAIGQIVCYKLITDKGEEISVIQKDSKKEKHFINNNNEETSIKGKTIVAVKLIPTPDSKRRKEELSQGAKEWETRRKAEKEEKAKEKEEQQNQ